MRVFIFKCVFSSSSACFHLQVRVFIFKCVFSFSLQLSSVQEDFSDLITDDNNVRGQKPPQTTRCCGDARCRGNKVSVSPAGWCSVFVFGKCSLRISPGTFSNLAVCVSSVPSRKRRAITGCVLFFQFFQMRHWPIQWRYILWGADNTVKWKQQARHAC